MADFTVEINRGQGDAVSLTVDKTSPNGLAFTYAFNKANVDNDTPFIDEPDYLKSLLGLMLASWRKQQQNEGVLPAFNAADETAQNSVRTTLGL